MLNTSSIKTSLVILSVHYSAYYRAAYTFEGVPEGTYYERIFHLFPLIRICRLGFYRYIWNVLDNKIVLPFSKAFISIETILFNLQSIAFEHCSLNFLLHILEHHPQLQELSFGPSTPWLPDRHTLMNVHKK
ncbi:unnamed protein product [Rotaria sp. Silwood2]|nr:unnamed protein product [Rotaria sp. Silwood2]